MKSIFQRSAAWAMDTVMCEMMNLVQWRRRAESTSTDQLSRYLAAHAAMSREEYYRLTPAVAPRFTSDAIQWESPMLSGHPENDRVHVDFFPCGTAGAPVVLLLHALMSASRIGYRGIARWFNERGWHAAFPHLPFHYSRRPRRTMNGELAITSDLVRNARGLRQGVLELRQLMALLRARGTREFGLLGTSYGGWTGALLSFVEADFRFIALVQPIVDVEAAIWENPGARSMRRMLHSLGHRPGITRAHAHLISPLDGVPLARNILITAGLYDRVSPPEQLRELASRWPSARLITVPQGHFGYDAMRETLKHVAPLL